MLAGLDIQLKCFMTCGVLVFSDESIYMLWCGIDLYVFGHNTMDWIYYIVDNSAGFLNWITRQWVICGLDGIAWMLAA